MNNRNDYPVSPTKRSLPVPGPLAPVIAEHVKKLDYLYTELDQLRNDHERLKERFEIFLEANELWDGQK